MLLSLRWLRELIDIPIDAELLSERLTFTGTEVESLVRPCGKLKGVVIARVVALDPHPSSANLLLARLDRGAGEALCVTAARNLSVGDLVCYAPPGATLADGTVMGTREFSGLLSQGMALSASELGVAAVETEPGILRLPGEYVIGADAVSSLGLDDEILELSITPNRGDLLSLLGVAREVHALVEGSQLREFEIDLPQDGAHWPVDFGGITLEGEGCTLYGLGFVDDVAIAPSPLDARIRLALLGQRPVSNVVDATNLTMFFLGQPLHAFDFDRLPSPEITVRSARPGETMRTLDGKDRSLDGQDLLITSGGRPVALAGVMGGENSEIFEGTRRVLMETAWFDPIRVSRTSRRLGLNSEAAYRFARVVDPARSLVALGYALSLISRWNAGRPQPSIHLRRRRTEAIGEVELTRDKMRRYLLWDDMKEAERILSRLGFDAERRGEKGTTFYVPSYRPDVNIEEDLIEEVARVRGYTDAVIPARLPGRPRDTGTVGEAFLLWRKLRETAMARGYMESVQYSFVSPESVGRLGLGRHEELLELTNPLSREQSVLRPLLLPSFLEALSGNLRKGWRGELRLFEIGDIFVPAEGRTGCDERRRFGAVLYGGRQGKALYGARGAEDFFSVKADVTALLAACRVVPSFCPDRLPFGHAGQTATLRVDGRPVGYLTRLKPLLEKELDLGAPLYAFEFDLQSLVGDKRPRFASETPFPALLRDISLLAPRSVTAAFLGDFIRSHGGAMLEGVELFDVYEGPSLPEGMRSLAFSLVYRHPERTLVDSEIEGDHRALRESLEAAGYRLR
ncbi:phenylalanine--tRNA ligase subunit beta [Aminithiophilus ramosus]|uniref:Phenylalanine--tRNA ligase beta subunit n=2 Tax=Synergistales TaxID=649776 RepID=A0A9Q7AD82_9BACT|nr:phenylalanine--tRNA ligase subunit beta [Aminithiophilus ramosus]QTX31339.1 phenylalanine--tRNA ligase subunit beta [Aminithiophilus ramosus]QVL35138.1 phenylalanine--tRNA ligase subunit beta [Synergistota bacterium]